MLRHYFSEDASLAMAWHKGNLSIKLTDKLTQNFHSK